MSTNTNKRIAVKWVRDRAKRAYEKASNCFVCGVGTDLELHHTHSVTLLLEQWAQRRGYDISTDAGICEVRDEFIEEHHSELYDQVYTLCAQHHQRLHSVYGKSPAHSTAPKQVKWLELQRDRAQGLATKPVSSPFQKLLRR